MFADQIHDDDRRRTKKHRKRQKLDAEILNENSSHEFIELSKSQVKAALSSLICRERSTKNLDSSRKRARTKSDHRSKDEQRKKKKNLSIYDETLLPTVKQPENIVLATSGLSSKQLKQVKKFVLLFNCRLLLLDDHSCLNSSVTHLITDEIGSDDSLVCTLTKSVVFAIAQHCFLISFRWIIRCLQENLLVNEEEYEIEGDHLISTKHNGPRRSRLSKQPLFPMNYFLMIKGCSGHFLDFTNRELGDLAWLTGAIYLEQNRFPNTIFSRQCFLLIEDEDIRNKTMFHRCIDKGLKFLRSEWLIRSVVEYRVADIVQHHCDPFDTIDRSDKTDCFI